MPPDLILLFCPVTTAGVAAALGAAIGCAWPSAIAGIAGGGVAMLLGIIHVFGIGEFVAPLSSSVTLIDVRPSTVSVGLNIGAGIILVLAICVFVGLVSARSARPVTRLLSSVVTLALLGGGFSATSLSAQEPMFVAANPVPVGSCSVPSNGIEFCITVDAGYDSDATASAIAPYIATMRDNSLEPMKRYVQGGGSTTTTGDNATGLILTTGAPADQASIRAADFVAALAAPRPCAQFWADQPPIEAIVARDVVAQWLSVATVGRPLTPASPRELSWLNGTGAIHWVQDTYPKLAGCDLAAIDIPTAYAQNLPR